MWICLNDAFLSIVAKDCAPNELLVRARRRDDIIKVFPEAKVIEIPGSDYQFRAAIERAEIAGALAGEVARIDYPNFKDSVSDRPLHDAYLKIWQAMAALQPRAPFSGFRRSAPRLPLHPMTKPKKGAKK